MQIAPTDRALIKAADKQENAHPSLSTLIGQEKMLAAAGVSFVDQPIGANCLTTYRAQRISGTRPLSQITLMIIHCTQGSTARAAASWFADPASQGSAHLSVDDRECYRTLRDDEIPWGAPGANYHGIHFEQAGFVTWSQAIWSQTHRRTIMRCAYKVAFHCRKYNVPTRWLSVADLKAGKSGIADHWNCTQAFGGDHTDPGPNYPRALFMALVRGYATAHKAKQLRGYVNPKR